MPGFPSPWSGAADDDDDLFDGYDEFAVDHVPMPARFLEGHDVLAGSDHVAFHRLTRELFEKRKVYDMTFNYNLARLNLDTRHTNAGYRYAVEVPDADDSLHEPDVDRVLRAEFTPTTPFCPQTHTLTLGSFRAWNGLADRHEYDLVRVRASPTHHASDDINAQLADLERRLLETGEIADDPESGPAVGSNPMEGAVGDDRGDEGSGGNEDDGASEASRGSTEAPF